MTESMQRDDWNRLVANSPGGCFLQSWEWGELQAALQVPYWRLTGDDGVALVARRPLPGGRSWFYVPRGPVWKSTNTNNVLSSLIDLAKKERVVFVRVEPSQSGEQDIESEQWQRADHSVQPEHTLVLDLDKSEDELLADMHQKTRYNIRLAQKKGVLVRLAQDESGIENFLKISREVSGRSSFHYHPDDYYRIMNRVLSPAGMLEVVVAEYNGQVLAVHLLCRFGQTVTYVHGASSSDHRAVMAPHLLQWESIKRAKETGAKVYDFFGVAPKENKDNHPWAGITRFKEGFGGRRVDYPGAYDRVLDRAWYWIYNTARRSRGLLRRGGYIKEVRI